MLKAHPIEATELAHLQRVKRGEQCPICFYRGRSITREKARGIPLFACPCGEKWFDLANSSEAA